MTGQTLTSANGGGPAEAIVLALVLFAAPLFIGVLLGGVLGRHRGYVTLAATAVAVLTALGLRMLPQVGAWDTIGFGALMVAGLLFGSAGIDRRSAVTLVVSLIVAVVGVEVGLRQWLPPPPRFPNAENAALVFEPEAWDAGCSVLYAEDIDADLHVLRRAKPNPKTPQHPPLVIHLGDSMTYGEGVKAEEAFPALLDARSQTIIHRNYGVWAVGTDFQYLMLLRILDAHSPAMVVVHVYGANDIYDIDRPYACCDAGPLLEYDPDWVAARCVDASWRLSLAFRLSRSPPPYPLRVATHWSYTARHAAAAFSRLVSWFEPRADFVRSEGEASETGWQHFTQILTHMHDELPPNVELIVNLLPSRQALEAPNPKSAPSYRASRRVATIAEELGIRTLDAWSVFATAVHRDGVGRYFREHDIHFTPEGHRLLATWLETQLVAPPER
jgi:lysophospholipase L1-like esterase